MAAKLNLSPNVCLWSAEDRADDEQAAKLVLDAHENGSVVQEDLVILAAIVDGEQLMDSRRIVPTSTVGSIKKAVDKDLRDHAKTVWMKYTVERSDHVTLVNLWRAWMKHYQGM